eukprot:3127674-Pyramimonas_sp.AAC.2
MVEVQPSSCLEGFIVTDPMFPGGEKAPSMPGLFLDRVDLTITSGFSYYGSNGLASDIVGTDPGKSPCNSSNQRQYMRLPRHYHLHRLNESFLGPNAAATNIIIGPKYQIDGIKRTCTSFPSVVVRLHIPEDGNGQPIFGIRMGRGLKFTHGPLMAHNSGPNTTTIVDSHMVRASSGEVQLDICSLIMRTLRAKGTVVSLASSECRLFDALKHNDADTLYYNNRAPVIAGDAACCWGKR